MYTERQAIQDEMHDNRRQINLLRDRNQSLLSRLREIDERDMKDEVSYDALNTLTASLTEVIGKMGDIIPHIPVGAMIEHITKQVDTSIVEVAASSEEVKKDTPVEKEKEQERIHSKPKKPGNMSIEKAGSIIKAILQEKGMLKSKILEDEFFARTGKRYSNFTTQLNKAMEKFPSIKKVGKGYYMVTKDAAMINSLNAGNKDQESFIS